MKINLSSISCVEHEPEIAKPLLKELRRADNFIRMAVSTVYEALSSRYPIDEETGADWGLVVGTAFGPMETNFNVLDQVVNNDQTSPTLFSHSVFNAAAGYLTRIFNIRGNTSTITDFFYPFFQALSLGWNAIHSGKVRRCIVLQVETYSHLLQDARSAATMSTIAQWPSGGVAWLLERNDTTASLASLNTIKIKSTPNWENSYLQTNDTLTCNDERITVTHPLAAPLYLSDKLNHQGKREPLRFQIISNIGTVELLIN